MSSSILIVDDEVDACRNLADILSDLGYTVAVAHDARSALAEVEHRRFDVALLDLMMPDLDGAALYQELKRKRPEMVAVLTTAYPTHPRAEAGLRSGVWRIMPKPLDLGGLLSAVAEALQLPLLLVVDDDRDLCENLWDLFQERGFRIGFADGVRSAAEKMQQSAVKIALVDMKLNDGNGGQVIEALQALQPHPRTILITGNRDQFAPSIARLQTEVDAVCYKPFDLSELLTMVDRLGDALPRSRDTKQP